jgi:hypothetical protein
MNNSERFIALRDEWQLRRPQEFWEEDLRAHL